MLLVYFVAAAVPIGYLLGGRLRNYSNAPLRMVLLPCAAFLIEASFGLIGRATQLPPEKWLGWAVCAEYLLLALFIWFNRDQKGVKLLGAATVANFAVISANGFRMPITPLVYENAALADIIRRVQSGELVEYTLVDWNGPLWFLGDTLPMFGGLASVGDLMMAAAILIIIVTKMKAQPTETE